MLGVDLCDLQGSLCALCGESFSLFILIGRSYGCRTISIRVISGGESIRIGGPQVPVPRLV